MARRSRTNLVEDLEMRRLFATANLVAGVLTLHADAGSASTISVDFSSDNLGVDISVTSVNGKGVSSTLAKTFPKTSSINSVRIFGSSKADTIVVGQSSHGFSYNLLTSIDARGGDNTVTTGAEADTIVSGNGRDQIRSGDGDDLIRSGGGNDVIIAGDGADKIDSGAGNDTVTTGSGDNTLRAGAGNDNLTLGNGNSLAFGEAGNDIINAGSGNDTLWGGAGNDNIHAGSGHDTFGGVDGKNTLIGTGGPDTYVVKNSALKGQTTSYDADNGDTLVVVPRENHPPRI